MAESAVLPQSHASLSASGCFEGGRKSKEFQGKGSSSADYNGQNLRAKD